LLVYFQSATKSPNRHLLSPLPHGCTLAYLSGTRPSRSSSGCP
jgi:hypothetical protein